MTDDDLKKIGDLIDGKLNKALGPIQSDLAGVKDDLAGVKDDLAGVKDDLAGVKDDLAGVKDILENRVLPSVMETETTLKSYGDRYKINEDHIGRLDTRLSQVEAKHHIEPPENLKIPHFTD